MTAPATSITPTTTAAIRGFDISVLLRAEIMARPGLVFRGTGPQERYATHLPVDIDHRAEHPRATHRVAVAIHQGDGGAIRVVGAVDARPGPLEALRALEAHLVGLVEPWTTDCDPNVVLTDPPSDGEHD